MMKKFIAGILCILLCMGCCPVWAAECHARSAVVMEAHTGQILYAQNETARAAMASTTKIMTALLTLEYAQIENKTVTVSAQAAATEGSALGLTPGERITLYDLAVGMLIVSGNDAANAAAEGIAGSVEDFVILMNRRAQELKLYDTHFDTPSGLDGNTHYTTALDLARLTAIALQNKSFAKLVATQSCVLHTAQGDKTLVNHNKLLSRIEGCIGVKTGYTDKAGRCLVSAAQRNGVTLICVTLGDADDWNDHTALLEEGFSQMSCIAAEKAPYCGSIPVVGGEEECCISTYAPEPEPFYTVNGKAAVVRTVWQPTFLYAPVKAGQCVGRVVYTCDGQEKTVPLYVYGTVPLRQKEPKTGWWEAILQKLTAWLGIGT